MRANQREFIKIIAEPNTTFVIPVYQRNYDWRIENCKQLFDDILKITNSDEYHFIGTICRKKKRKEPICNNRWSAKDYKYYAITQGNT